MIEKYLESKKYAWAESTIRNVEAHLRKWGEHVHGEPPELYEKLLTLSPYSRLTVWTYLADYYTWLTGSNKFHQWRKENARAFKNAYKPKTPKVSFKEAALRISRIKDSEVQTKAYQLLKGGLRYAESFKIQGGTCIGKGSKQRKVFVEEVPYTKSYSWFYRTLKKETGLTPHDLRKIRANDLCEKGARPEELTAIMGWESFSTAQSYIEANDKRLDKLMED